MPEHPLRIASGTVLAAFVAVPLFVGSAMADMTVRSTLRLKVGETRRIGTFGGHKSDYQTSLPPEIRMVRAPALGTVSESEGVSYVARRSLSGTCLGASLIGTAVDYTASAAGSDMLQFDAVFPNGSEHRIVTITNR